MHALTLLPTGRQWVEGSSVELVYLCYVLFKMIIQKILSGVIDTHVCISTLMDIRLYHSIEIIEIDGAFINITCNILTKVTFYVLFAVLPLMLAISDCQVWNVDRVPMICFRMKA